MRTLVVLSALLALGAGVLAGRPRRAPATPTPPATGLPTGMRLPELALRDDAGRPFALSSLRGEPALLVFFRGASCPYCRTQLATLDEVAARARASRTRIIAISPDSPPVLARLRRETQVAFPLVSDESEAAVTALCGGLSHCEVLVDAEGFVKWAGASESWSKVPKFEDLLAL